MAFKRGDNIRFICTYLYENPGATYSEVRNALCEFRGIDPKRRPGHYTWYFRDTTGWIPMMGCGGPPRKNDTRWVKRDRRYYLTERGLAWVSVA